MNTLAHYLSELRKIRSLGAVPETSYYPPLSELLTTIGLGLSPKVRCIVHPKSQGAGIPDLALFSSDQIPLSGQPLPGVLPSRGVIEAKGTNKSVDQIATLPQVAKYLERYGQVLVTNLREFVLMTPEGAKERFRLAETEEAFWDSNQTDDSEHAAFADFLRRVLLSNAPLTEPKDVAWLLASYAHEARTRLLENELAALDQLRAALEETLGITFTGERGDHFFRSTLVQTLFYGIFSAWVLWAQRHPTGRFEWKLAAYELRVPMIRALFHQAADPGRLEPLGLVEILNWAGDALNRVERAEFFKRFAADNAVQYFYEPFLEAFDPVLRKDLGVWYTPREIVRYQVARVDTVLREELGVAAGLADPNVVVLDPCCGTGAYLVEVLRVIYERLTGVSDPEEGGTAVDMLALSDVKKAAMGRVFGFEILPAPFVVAHLQLGLMLQTMGAALSASGNERVGVYLTNALTGWDGEPPQKAMVLPELLAERDAAGKVKREAKILVILGNPPYNGYAGIAVEEERALSEAYRTTQNPQLPQPQGQGLNDLYVRFFRMAERRIVEGTGCGIVCFISNYSWLDGLSFSGMRERYLEKFDLIFVDNLHGDRIISEYAPDGRTSETVFAGGGLPGIKVGTAVATLVRKNENKINGEHLPASLKYRDFDQAKAQERRISLLTSVSEKSYKDLSPLITLGLPFKPRAVGANYLEWAKLTELFPVSFPGVKTSRDSFLVDIDRARLEKRIHAYFDPQVTNDEIKKIDRAVMEYSSRYDPSAVRTQLLKRGIKEENFVRYAYRPFDTRWLYWEPETKLLDEKRSEYKPHVFTGNLWLTTQMKSRREWSFPQASTSLGCLDLMDRGANLIPLKLRITELDESDSLEGHWRWNLSDAARRYLTALDIEFDTLFFHTIATMHSSSYRLENGGALYQDWARIPLPTTREVLEASAMLGKQVAALLDTETPVQGVTIAPVRDDLKSVAVLTRNDSAGLQDGDLAITAGWGNATQTGIMPGRGKVAEGQNGTLDIYLNDHVAWRGVPATVWQYTLGGYQVLKKWLSYREQRVLGRPLTAEEAREFQQTARRIAALLALGAELDANYVQVKMD